MSAKYWWMALIVLSCGVQAETTELFPLEDIRPGMIAEVRTAIRGTEMREFEVEIIDVTEDE